MKKLFIAVLLTVSIFSLQAQQRYMNTFFMTNPFAINPAIAGTYNYFQIVSNNRFQWVGLDDAPTTNTLSFFGPTTKFPMGYGATITYDIAGKISMGSFHASYAYLYTVNEDIKLSMGLNLGILQYKVAMGEIHPREADDPVMLNEYTGYKPDASIGVYLFTSQYQFGLTAAQLFNNKLAIGSDTSKLSKLKTHFYFTAGYKYYINREWAIEPTFIIKKVVPAPYQLDFNVRGFYRKMLWFGFSYRTQEAFSILAGYIYEDKIQIGYAYDIILNDIGVYSNTIGSHEIILSYKFGDIK